MRKYTVLYDGETCWKQTGAGDDPQIGEDIRLGLNALAKAFDDGLDRSALPRVRDIRQFTRRAVVVLSYAGNRGEQWVRAYGRLRRDRNVFIVGIPVPSSPGDVLLLAACLHKQTWSIIDTDPLRVVKGGNRR
jgi:hypothetical protein